MTIPIKDATDMIAAGSRAAQEVGVPMNIAVLDDGGRLRVWGS